MRLRHSPYWRKTLLVTVLLLAIWAGVTLPSAWYAADLNRLRILGWPLGYFLAAQGTVLIYLAIVVFYGWYMNRLDRTSQREDQT